MSTETYNVCALILQLVIGGFIIATFIVYFKQLKAMRGQLETMRNGATGQNILSVVAFLQAPYVRDARTTVRNRLKEKPFAKWDDWDDTEKRDASLVCSTYDVLSILIYQQKLVPAEPFISNWGASIKDCYEICEPYIIEMQKPEHSGPTYWNDFQILYSAVARPTHR